MLCGHIPNDRGYNPDETYKEDLNNAYFYLGDVWSAKDIDEGEEIYVAYGKSYWYGEHNRGSGKSRNDIIKYAIEHNGCGETSGDTTDTENITD